MNKLRTLLTQWLDYYLAAQAKLYQDNPDAYLYAYWY